MPNPSFTHNELVTLLWALRAMHLERCERLLEAFEAGPVDGCQLMEFESKLAHLEGLIAKVRATVPGEPVCDGFPASSTLISGAFAVN